MTERQFKTITKKLHFYNQGGIKNLCTMTETTLRQVMEEAAGVTQAYIRKLAQHDVDQQNKIALLSAKVYKLEKENAERKAEIENDRDLPAITYLQGAEKQKRKDEEQLTKAKELLKDITSSYGSTEVSEAQLYLKIKKADIFLKDSEVEK